MSRKTEKKQKKQLAKARALSIWRLSSLSESPEQAIWLLSCNFYLRTWTLEIYALKQRCSKSVKSRLLGDVEATNSTRKRISSLKVLHFLLYPRSFRKSSTSFASIFPKLSSQNEAWRCDTLQFLYPVFTI